MSRSFKSRGRIFLEVILAVGLIGIGFLALLSYFEGHDLFFFRRTANQEEVWMSAPAAVTNPEAVQLLEEYMDAPEKVPSSLRPIYKELFQEVTSITTNETRVEELVTTIQTYNQAQEKISTTEVQQTTTVTQTTTSTP